MPTQTTITFTGLLVFRRDPATRNFEVGVLRARTARQPHFLAIQVTPNPDGSETLRLERELEDHISHGHLLWELDVEPDGSSAQGIDANFDPPADRKIPDVANVNDFGWIINLQREFHPNLNRQPGGLQPVILFKTGKFSTSCKTDFIDVQERGTTRKFGFIAGALRLTIDTSQGQQPVLNAISPDKSRSPIFRLTDTDQNDYEISISNIPLPGSASTTVGGHFHLFYDLLFTGIPHHERIAIERHMPRISTQDRCPDAGPDPDPFRCGGVVVEGDPLG